MSKKNKDKSVKEEINSTIKDSANDFIEFRNTEKFKRSNIKNLETNLVNNYTDKKNTFIQKLEETSKNKNESIEELQNQLDDAMRGNDLEAIEKIMDKMSKL